MIDVCVCMSVGHVPDTNIFYSVLFYNDMYVVLSTVVSQWWICKRAIAHRLLEGEQREFCRLFTARSNYARAVLGIVILSVCPSVRRTRTFMFCDEMKEHTADILIP